MFFPDSRPKKKELILPTDEIIFVFLDKFLKRALLGKLLHALFIRHSATPIPIDVLS